MGFVPPHMDPEGRKTGPLQFLILIQLENSPKYGYEMLKAINEEFKGIWELKTGTLYPALKRMEIQQLIEIQPKGDVDFYHLTEKGRELLVQPFTAQGNVVEFGTRFFLAAAKWMSPRLRNQFFPQFMSITRDEGRIQKTLLSLLDDMMTREEKIMVLRALKETAEMRLQNITKQLREAEST